MGGADPQTVRRVRVTPNNLPPNCTGHDYEAQKSTAVSFKEDVGNVTYKDLELFHIYYKFVETFDRSQVSIDLSSVLNRKEVDRNLAI